jgi:hypothetical protein
MVSDSGPRQGRRLAYRSDVLNAPELPGTSEESLSSSVSATESPTANRRSVYSDGPLQRRAKVGYG